MTNQKQETKTTVATAAQEHCIIRAQAIVHRLEYGGLIFAKGAKFYIDADKAEALEKLGKLKIIGA